VARPRDETEQIEFAGDDTAALVGRMRTLAVDRSGWVNVRPLVDAEELPRRRGLDALLNAGLPLLAIGTWIPGAGNRRGREPDTVGIQHPTGRRVATRLVEAGLRPPEGWRGIQDHARRGLIVELPEGTDPARVLAWLLPVLVELGDGPDPDTWRATIHHR
jgi:hypothetical protein